MRFPSTSLLPHNAKLTITFFSVNIGNARLYHLERDLGLVGNQFQVAVSILFVTYITFEVPSNLVLKKFTPSRWIAFITFFWGVTATLNGLVQSYGGLLACRVVLGALEAGLFPGMNLYLTFFYTKTELAMRVGYLFVSAAIAGALGGLLAFGIGNMDGIQGMSGWRVSVDSNVSHNKGLNNNTVDHDHRGHSHGYTWSCHLLPPAQRSRVSVLPER